MKSLVTESIPFSASIKTQEFLQPEPASPVCPLLPLTSLHRRPEVDKGGGPSAPHQQQQQRPGEESCPPQEHSVLGEPCPS